MLLDPRAAVAGAEVGCVLMALRKVALAARGCQRPDRGCSMFTIRLSAMASCSYRLREALDVDPNRLIANNQRTYESSLTRYSSRRILRVIGSETSAAEGARLPTSMFFALCRPRKHYRGLGGCHPVTGPTWTIMPCAYPSVIRSARNFYS